MVTETRVDPVTGTKQDFIDRAAAATLAGYPAAQVTPAISGIETAEIQLDALTTAQIVEVRATYWTNSQGDSVQSAQRLADSKPDVEVIYDGDVVTLKSDDYITNVTIAMLANIAVAEAAYDAATKTATGTLVTNTALADFETVQVEFDFDAEDKINAVDMSLITFSDGTTDKNLGRFKIAGYSK